MAATLTKYARPGKPTRVEAAQADDLLAWYERHARRLPWRIGPAERRRGQRPDPYVVLLSEVMLQQTTVKAVVPYFHRVVERWPSIADLAAAPETDVMAAWAGLGYYSRARNLIAAARSVAAGPDARLPRTAAELAELPGIGAYTSAAIAAIAFDERVAVVDGNVERVVARLFAIDTPFPAGKRAVPAALTPLLPASRAGEFAEALMDLGATICTPRRPACGLCPWSEPCVARREGRQEALPRRAEKKKRPTRYGAAFVARRADGAILLRRRPPQGLLGGMSEVPGSAWQEGSAAAAEPPVAADWIALALPVAHGFTHFELRLAVHRTEVGADMPAPPGHWWSAPADLPGEALPSVMKKAIEAAYPGRNKTAERAMTEIRHIVFDVGKVLVHYDPHLAYTDLMPDLAERDAFLANVCTNEWNVEQDRGRPWEEAEAEAIGRHPDKADLICAFRQNWHRMVSHAYDDSVAILRALIAGGHDVTLLTNFAADTFKQAQARFPFLTEPRGVTVSGLVRLLKPDVAIYRRHAADFGLTSAATLFFDDSPKNVEGARAAGWNAEGFESAAGMREDLRRYGVAV